MSKNRNIDLASLLPKQYRNRTLDTLLKSVFSNHLSKDESVILYGYVGGQADALPNDIYLTETDLERQVNQLSPVLYSKQGVEERLITWRELVQRMVTLGIPYDGIDEWLRVEALNFVPFIDIDKFANFDEYVWVGKWVLGQPTLPWEDLGIPIPAAITALATFNPNNVLDYYVIARGELSGTTPVAPYADLTSWSDWALGNMWVHKDDAFAFQLAHPTLNTNQLTQAIRPIIEFQADVKLNTRFTTQPADTGTLIGQAKTQPNQLPLFDLYYHDGSHSGYISSGFFYKESPDQPIDGALGRRIVRDEFADLIFGHSFVEPTEDRPLFLKRWDGSQFALASPWIGPHDLEQSFVKYETSGTIVNADKLQNYQSYYWSGVVDGPLPSYNPLNEPEYVVIEVGGTSGWSADNRWKHVSTLTTVEKLSYQQAQRPIIEFNVKLEAELIEAKAAYGQLPRFNLWAYDSDTATYVAPTALTDRLTDPYTIGTLFSDVTSLTTSGGALTTAAEQSALLLTVNGHQYAQSLLNGYYSNETNGVTYSYVMREFDREGAGDGQLFAYSLEPDALPHVVELQCMPDGMTFTVTSTVLGILPNLIIDTPYTVGGLTFAVVSGTTPFDDTTIIRFDVKSSSFVKTNLYVKVDGVYRTVSKLTDYLSNAALEDRQVNVDPAQGGGAWKCPSALFGNIDSNISATLKQGDLYSHFLSIIEAQPDLTGQAAGRNNWRELLTKDYSRGGIIKIFNDRLQLLFGLLSQDAADPISLLEFSQEAYTAVLNRTREFVEQDLAERIVAGDASFLSAAGAIDEESYKALRAYLERRSVVVAESETLVDDTVNSPFASSSMTLKALTLTAPYLGLRAPVEPKIALDGDQNMTVLVHHDGHQTPLPTVDFSVLKRLVTKRFKRSNGQETAGFVGGPVPPTKPFARHLWLDLSGEKLYVFDVVSDTGELPAVASHGQFSYNRQTNETWQYNGSWVSLGTTQSAYEAPWRELNLSATLTALMLRLEQELYNGVPALTLFDTATLEADARWEPMMQKEFEAFASNYDIIDPYACSYDPANPFTWSYTGIGVVNDPATWQQVYANAYGTSRPDLKPWIPAGYGSEAAFIADLITLGALPPGTTAWSAAYWALPAVVTEVRNMYVANGKPSALSVEASTGALIPPYNFGHAEEFLSTLPPDPTRRYEFGELGPVELAWRSTLDYVTSTLKTYFRLNPLNFVNQLWGDQLLKVEGYDVIVPIGRKPHIADVLIHGEPINRTTLSPSDVSLTCVLAPPIEMTYVISVASAKDELLRVTEAGSLTSTYCPASSIVIDAWVTGALEVPRDGLNLDDKLIVTISDIGELTVSLDLGPLKLEGLSQLYAHFHSYAGYDMSYSADRVRLLGWTPKLAYRFNTLVDTDVLNVKIEGNVVDKSGFNVYLKETELQSASWLTGLKITLLQRGSTQLVNGKYIPAKTSTGQRGDDWIYRVDLTCKKHPALQWYEYAGAYETFFALSGKSSTDEWRRYTQRTQLRTMRGPFIVKGLQALATFIFGYADRAEELGFRFNDPQDPVTDPSTGRLIGYQLLVEQLIDTQFNNPTESSFFQVLPFEHRIWFKANYGFVSDLSKRGASRLVPGLYTTSHARVQKGKFRVFRDGANASITSDVPLTGALLTTSVFEHVLVLEDAVGDTVVVDHFLNQHVDRLFLEGFKQATPTGRPFYGGKYLVGNQMRTNMEGSVQQLSSLYDISSLKNEDLFDRASALVAFDRKDYHVDLGTTLPTQLQFWRGMLKSKGTNRAVSSFVNSSLYRSALIDEHWAYKISEYGDLRRALKVELNVRANDMVGERAAYLLLEGDELDYIKELYTAGGYDMTLYDELAYDLFTLYSNEQIINMDIVDPRGCIIIKPDDEVRWNSYTDLGSITYMKAMIYATQVIVPGGGGYDMEPYDTVPYDDGGELIFTIYDKAGKEVIADCFEIVDLDATSGANVYDTPVLDITSYMKSGSKIYRETGDYITGTVPAEYSTPKFKRINASQVLITDLSLIGKRLLVIAYGPPLARFSPSQLYRDEGGRDTPVTSDIIWWDPARGVHSPHAHAAIDFQSAQDPARYNNTALKYKSRNSDISRVWGPEQVGQMWWNTTNAGWMCYSDTKLYPFHNDRLSQWGALADWASIDIAEWVESEKPPTAWDGTGEVAVKNYLTRSRTWWQRPVVWLYSANPQLTAKAPTKAQTATLELLSDGLYALDGAMPAFDIDERIARMQYDSTAREVFVKPIGCLSVIDNEVTLVAGSAASFSSPELAATPSFTDLTVTVTGSVSPSNVPWGAVTLDYEQEDTPDENGVITYIRATLESGHSQRVMVSDSPVKAGTAFDISFDSLGFKLTAKTVYGHADWGLTKEEREEQIGIELGSAAHDITIRQRIDVETLIDIEATTLEGSSITSEYGWVSWNVPSYILTADDLDESFGSWEALVGEYTAVGYALNDRKTDIQSELQSPQPVRQYEERWTPWKVLERRVNEGTYYPTVNFAHQQALEAFGFDTITEEDAERIALYVNGVRLLRGGMIVNGPSGYYVYAPTTAFTAGAKIRAELPFRIPTGDELKTVLEGSTADPTKLVEYKLDMPYVKHEHRNEFGRINKTLYYYWVKNKELPGRGKKLSTKLAAQQLEQHPGPYAVPQIMKRFNQLDGRPNRYGMLVFSGLTRFVRKDEQYKVRITENGSMRDDDQDISLRTTHSEWKLIRKNQPTRIPRELWDKLVDTLCGETATGQTLPFASYSEYDDRNNTTSRIGLKQGQVLSDPSQAIATVKGTLLDTQVVTYDQVTSSFISAPLEFAGYDSSKLDTYLATPTSIREFMANVWNNGDPRNVNELFFAVLEDSLSSSYELADVMKTSFITLDEVRAVVVEG